MTEPLRLIALKEVLYRTGLKKSTLYNKINAEEFPKPVPLGDADSGRVAWPEWEVERWILARVLRRDNLRETPPARRG